MNPGQQNPTFIQACKYIADHPYLNSKGKGRRFATLAELLTKSHLIIKKSEDTNDTGRDFFTHADEEDSNYFIGKAKSSRSIINEFIRENINNKVKGAHVDFGKMVGEPSFKTCNLNWRITGFKKILLDTKDKYQLEKIEVVEQPYSENKLEIDVDPSQYLLELNNLEEVVDINKAYYFIFTLNDLTTEETKTFAYPIDFKAQ